MKAIEFPQVTNRIAEDQPQYMTLPAYVGQVGVTAAETGIVCCMELDDKEWRKVLVNRKVWVRVLTFGRPLQPFQLQFDKDIFKGDDSIDSYTKDDYHNYQDFHHVEVRPSFWQRVQMLFGYRLKVVMRSNSYGFRHSLELTEHGVFTHKPNN